MASEFFLYIQAKGSGSLEKVFKFAGAASKNSGRSPTFFKFVFDCLGSLYDVCFLACRIVSVQSNFQRHNSDNYPN